MQFLTVSLSRKHNQLAVQNPMYQEELVALLLDSTMMNPTVFLALPILFCLLLRLFPHHRHPAVAVLEARIEALKSSQCILTRHLRC